MAATLLNITTEQGADYGPLSFTWHEDGPEVDGVITPGDPIDVTGFTARLMVRDKRSSVTGELYLTASSEEGHIVLSEDPTEGLITVLIPGDLTEGIVKVKAFYDLKMISPEGAEFFVLYGVVTNRLMVTVDDV